MWAGLVTFEAVRGNLLWASCLVSRGLLDILGILWPVGSSPHSPNFTVFFLCGCLFVCVCVHISPLYNDTSFIGLETHSIPG